MRKKILIFIKIRPTTIGLIMNFSGVSLSFEELEKELNKMISENIIELKGIRYKIKS